MLKNWIVQLVIILMVSTLIALAVNAGRDQGIALIGNWPSRTATGEGPITPPSAEEGDPPFITLDDAVAKFQSPDIIFIDARDPEDYQYGRIQRAINIPFDYLDDYWEEVLDSLDRGKTYVIYCSGTECESSLYLGRYMAEDLGFTDLLVFFGGWQEWVDNDLPTVSDEEEG
ncbi:MAG: rhodanese-like domain-containing protein [FCB group bacterium]|nr:rhodanese-like domain-containing protein [FCB group bacterium]